MGKINKTKLCAKINSLRMSKGLSQSKLARLCYVQPQSVHKWIRGLSAPDESTLIHVAKALGITMEQLLEGCYDD